MPLSSNEIVFSFAPTTSSTRWLRFLRQAKALRKVGLSKQQTRDLFRYLRHYGAVSNLRVCDQGHAHLDSIYETQLCFEHIRFDKNLFSCEHCGQCRTCHACKPAACGHIAPAPCQECSKCARCCRCVFCYNSACRRYSGTRAAHTLCIECLRCAPCCQCLLRVPRLEQPSPPVFHTAGKLQFKVNASRRFLSAEIEVSSITNRTGIREAVQYWAGGIVDDGSLPRLGFEINTAPANGDRFVQQIDAICAALKTGGAKANEKCGLHVHVDARDFSYYDLRNLIYVYALIEPALFEMVPQRRRDSDYCRPCGLHYFRTFIRGRTKYKDLRKSVFLSVYQGEEHALDRPPRKKKYVQARYNALNVHSWFYRGTIECRMYPGTVNPHSIISWATMWAEILDYATKVDSAELHSRAQTLLSASAAPRETRVLDGAVYLHALLGKRPHLQSFLYEKLLQHTSWTRVHDWATNKKQAAESLSLAKLSEQVNNQLEIL